MMGLWSGLPGAKTAMRSTRRAWRACGSTSRCAQAGAGATVCLVCLEAIPKDAPTWACRDSCHVVLHLLCAQAWARQQLRAAAARAADPSSNPDLCALTALPCRMSPGIVPLACMATAITTEAKHKDEHWHVREDPDNQQAAL